MLFIAGVDGMDAVHSDVYGASRSPGWHAQARGRPRNAERSASVALAVISRRKAIQKMELTSAVARKENKRLTRAFYRG